MYTISFYSFKGGVGRTMALANVGAKLAQTGRKVLMVDFDLEAPGLGTYDFPKEQPEHPGILEFVNDYIDTNRAPDVTNYLYQSPGYGKEGGKLWMMPAGIQDDNYAGKFGRIDWNDLYENRDGFLLMEDLKRQWEELGVDYVLIDSRTGHSDVVGICTRQLPDAVVLMMFPNAQNLVGLRKVVSDVKAQSKLPGNKSIQLHFVISNVPDLDDENQILKKTFDQFSEQLGYEKPCTIIHRYQSLALVNQDIFSVGRPRTRLAREYVSLIDEIITYNDEDKEGAKKFLTSTLMGIRVARMGVKDSEIGAADLQRRIEKIEEKHSDDPDILFALGQLNEAEGQMEESLELYKQAKKQGYFAPALFIAMARIEDMLGDKKGALSSIRAFLKIEKVRYFDISLAAKILSKISPNELISVAESPALLSMEHSDQLEVASKISEYKGGFEVSEAIIRRVRSESGDDGLRERSSSTLVLGQINHHRYDEAIEELLKTVPDEDNKIDSIANTFNLGMAKWGQYGEPNVELFQKVIDLDKDVKRDDFNYIQCLAIAHYVVGNYEEAKRKTLKAKRQLSVRPRRSFSAWNFKEASPVQLKKHLEQMQEMIAGGDVVPEVVAELRG